MNFPRIITAVIVFGLGVAPTAYGQKDTESEDWMEAFELCAQEPESPEESIIACSTAIDSSRLEPLQLAAAYYNRGRVHTNAEDFDKAVEDFNSAIQLNELDPVFYHDRGTAQRKAKKYTEAVESYTKATDLGFEPKFGVYFNRGVAYHYKGDKDKALKDFQRADMLQPGNPQVQKVLRDMYGVEPAQE